jgi:hypothetical protein
MQIVRAVCRIALRRVNYYPLPVLQGKFAICPMQIVRAVCRIALRREIIYLDIP